MTEQGKGRGEGGRERPLPSDKKQHGNLASQEGVSKPPTPCDTEPWYSTYKTYITRTSASVSLEGGHDSLLRHKSQIKLWTQMYCLLQQSSCKLDLDTWLTPEAKNQTDLNCSVS